MDAQTEKSSSFLGGRAEGGLSDKSAQRSSDNLESSSLGQDGVLEAQQEKQPTRRLTGARWFLFNLSTLTAIFLYALDNTIVANVQPVIVNQFNAVADLPWLSVGFMIGGLAMVMPTGKLYALYDAKWLFIGFTVNFIAASALCGGAPNMPAEIIGRVWAGAGGNGMYYGLLHLITVNTTEKERPTYLAMSGMTWGLGTVLGPVVGGAFELYLWRWAFYLNCLFAVFIIPAYIFLIPSCQPAPDMAFMDKLRTFDWVGAIFSSGFLATFIVATNFGGAVWDWGSGGSIALYVVSGLLFVLFIVQQSLCLLTSHEHRMFPMHLLRIKEAVLLLVLVCCGGTVIYVSVYYIPLYFQFTRGDTAIKTAERILPLILIFIFAQFANGFLMSKLGYYKPWYVFGAVLSLIGAVLMSRVGLHTSNAAVYGYQILLGLGSGCFVQAGFSVIQTAIQAADSVHGVTLILFGQLSGLTFSLSMTGAIFINMAKNNLARIFPELDEESLVKIISGTSGSFLATVDESQRTRALESICKAMQNVFTEVYVASAVALVLSLLLKWKKVYGGGVSGGA